MLAGVCFADGWERTYGGSDDDWGYCITNTYDGGYLIIGTTESFVMGVKKMYAIKINSGGDTLWTRFYEGSEAYSVVQTTDSGYAIVGYIKEDILSDNDICFIKTNADGDTLWTHRYGTIDTMGIDIYDEVGYCIKQTTNGGYIIVGSAYSIENWNDVYLIKTDGDGNVLWERTYGGATTDKGFYVIQTSDGGYIVVGESDSFTGYFNVYIFKTDSSGVVEWTKNYCGYGYAHSYAIAELADGNFVIAGRTSGFTPLEMDNDVYIIKIDSLGDSLWTRTYAGEGDEEGPYDDIAYSITQTSDGGFAVVGYTSYWVGHDDVWLLKVNASGDTLWTRVYGGDNFDYANSVVQASDGGYVIAGSAGTFDEGSYDVYLIKTDSLGFAAINEPAAQKPVALSLTAYPNPFNSACAITVSDGRGLARQTLTNIEVYDIMGNVVWERSPDRDNRHREMSPTSHAFIWQPDKSITSGIYLIRATVEDRTITKRAILMK
ncbi:T9SS type A sorting domain-containing protein [bacterium]|nr:T9SS type A sorting domain-containing protein [bacterium]